MRLPSQRWLALALAAATVLVPSLGRADPPRGFGALDLGAALGAPLSGGGSNRWYPGAALEGGLKLNDLLQVGARVRFFPGSAGEHDGLRWGLSLSAGSASALVRLTFEPTSHLGVSVGVSAGYALFGDCYSNGTKGAACQGTGVAAGLDLRLAYRVSSRLGLHFSIEPQLVFKLEREAQVTVPAAWLGVDW